MDKVLVLPQHALHHGGHSAPSEKGPTGRTSGGDLNTRHPEGRNTWTYQNHVQGHCLPQHALYPWT